MEKYLKSLVLMNVCLVVLNVVLLAGGSWNSDRVTATQSPVVDQAPATDQVTQPDKTVATSLATQEKVDVAKSRLLQGRKPLGESAKESDGYGANGSVVDGQSDEHQVEALAAQEASAAQLANKALEHERRQARSQELAQRATDYKRALNR